MPRALPHFPNDIAPSDDPFADQLGTFKTGIP